MNIVVHNYYEVLNYNNNMFCNVGDVTINLFLEQMTALKFYGDKNQLNYATSSVMSLEESDGVLFVDFPKDNDVFFKKAVESNKPLFLLVWESGIINPMNVKTSMHHFYKKVFTYDDLVVDNIKYIKTPYSFNFPQSINKRFDGKELCCLIAGNKYSYYENELYSERLKIIRWFENNAPTEFSLFGRGWDKLIPPRNVFDKITNRYDFFKFLRKNYFKTYQGEVSDKFEVLSACKFSICFENARDLTGYISEKIFDCFFSGCIPVYLGADNITEFIPKECFVDYRDFDSISEVYEFLHRMDASQYFAYLYSIESFLSSKNANIFKNEFFAKTINKHIKSVVSND